MPQAIEERKQILDAELKRILALIIKQYKPEKIILFGSLATGKIHPYSDIDLVIIKSTDKRFIDRLHEVHLIAQPRVGVNFIVYTPNEVQAMVEENRYFLAEEILNKGEVLFDKDKQMA